MKRIFSFLLAALLLVSAVPIAQATTTANQGTQVEYIGTASEAYTITVPALLAPGGSGTVTLEGTWASDKTVKVTADTEVVLTNSINAADQKTLAVTFAGIEKAGSNTESQTFTEAVTVADIQDALFGTWSGKFNYNVEIADAPIPVVGSATFSKYLTSPDCHDFGYQHGDSCYTIEQNTLTWEELKIEQNGTTYEYDAAAITDTGIGSYAFSECQNLTDITIPEGVTTIDEHVFDSCHNLTNITIPASVTSIGDYVFSFCSNLTTINYAGTTEQWKAIARIYSWINDVPATEVICSDGTVALS